MVHHHFQNKKVNWFFTDLPVISSRLLSSRCVDITSPIATLCFYKSKNELGKSGAFHKAEEIDRLWEYIQTWFKSPSNLSFKIPKRSSGVKRGSLALLIEIRWGQIKVTSSGSPVVELHWKTAQHHRHTLQLSCCWKFNVLTYLISVARRRCGFGRSGFMRSSHR